MIVGTWPFALPNVAALPLSMSRDCQKNRIWFGCDFYWGLFAETCPLFIRNTFLRRGAQKIGFLLVNGFQIQSLGCSVGRNVFLRPSGSWMFGSEIENIENVGRTTTRLWSKHMWPYFPPFFWVVEQIFIAEENHRASLPLFVPQNILINVFLYKWVSSQNLKKNLMNGGFL